MPEMLEIPFTIKEESGISRKCEPITQGIPFPKGKVNDLSRLTITEQGKNRSIPFSAQSLNTWNDGSVRWGLFDFQVNLAAEGASEFLIKDVDFSDSTTHISPIIVFQNGKNIRVKTGGYEFILDKINFRPFKRVLIDEIDVLKENQTSTSIEIVNGAKWNPKIDSCFIETANDLKVILRFDGGFYKEKARHILRFSSRLFFYAGLPLVRLDFTIMNPQAAKHKGGLWDLGDPGSVLYKGLCLNLRLIGEKECFTSYRINPKDDFVSTGASVLISQESSGGKNWNSRNHLTRRSKIPYDFCGYRILESNRVVKEGLRATPSMKISSGNVSIEATIKEFWENFPSALESQGLNLILWPFPKYAQDLYELQGGEQKTHRFFIHFASSTENTIPLAWVHDPLIPVVSPNWYAETDVFPNFIPHEKVPKKFPYKNCLDIKDVVVKGRNTFFDRREIIDEFGWRNFGEVYADHENVLNDGKDPIISHYNNQYDILNSFLEQFIATGDKNWFILADQLTRHVIDIDIYHTDQDSYHYNRGLFWPTDHFNEAHTATHRTYSRRTLIQKNLKTYGGGPDYEHVYTQGLINYFFLGGEIQAKEAAFDLISYVDKGIGGPDRITYLLKEIIKINLKGIKKILCDRNNAYVYELLEGPGRSSGNGLSSLLDAFILTMDKHYIRKAEYLIRRCVHPLDNVAKKNLLDVNMRWSYTIFLLSLGKYLDIKLKNNEIDYMYCYAKESLLCYADWMVDNEKLFLSEPELLDFPNYATRACSDIRKSNIFLLAAQYSENPRNCVYLKKAEYFFEGSIKELIQLEDRNWTRPIAILMQNMPMQLYFSRFGNVIRCRNACSKKYKKSKTNSKIWYLFYENIRLVKSVFKKRSLC